MFGIVIVFFCCSLKKVVFIKGIFSWGWFDIYIYLVKTVVEIEIEQKRNLICLVKNAFQIEIVK